ncbi:MAG: hypothetical protein ACI85K_000500 [Hyphomicrobiaceae bacterium]
MRGRVTKASNRSINTCGSMESVAAGLRNGGLLGIAVPTLLFAVASWPESVIVVPLFLPILAMPVVVLQAVIVLLAPRWGSRRAWRIVTMVLAWHLLSIAAWILLWSGTEYGSSWPSVFQFLLLAHTVPVAMQLIMAMRRQEPASSGITAHTSQELRQASRVPTGAS